jgi:two-component system, chemotaxis family, CheB/CheR fusion protein
MRGESARPVTVLHVEDDAALAASVEALLGTQGFHTVTATDAASALAWLASPGNDPDVLIVDFHLPGEMNGTDFAEEAHRRLGRVVPTIFTSGDLSNVDLPWLPGTPLLFASKPVDAAMLLEVVESFALLGRVMRPQRRRAAG